MAEGQAFDLTGLVLMPGPATQELCAWVNFHELAFPQVENRKSIPHSDTRWSGVIYVIASHVLTTWEISVIANTGT